MHFYFLRGSYNAFPQVTRNLERPIFGAAAVPWASLPTRCVPADFARKEAAVPRAGCAPGSHSPAQEGSAAEALLGSTRGARRSQLAMKTYLFSRRSILYRRGSQRASPGANGHRAPGDRRAFVRRCTLSVSLEASEREGHFSERGNASELGSVSPAPLAELDVKFLIRQKQEKNLPLLSGCCAGHLSCCCIIAQLDA